MKISLAFYSNKEYNIFCVAGEIFQGTITEYFYDIRIIHAGRADYKIQEERR